MCNPFCRPLNRFSYAWYESYLVIALRLVTHAMPYSTLCPAAAAAVALPGRFYAGFGTHSCVTRLYKCTSIYSEILRSTHHYTVFHPHAYCTVLFTCWVWATLLCICSRNVSILQPPQRKALYLVVLLKY